MPVLPALLTLLLAAPPLSPQAEEGRAVVQRAQCNRCHDVTDADGAGRGVAAAEQQAHCVNCHTWILGTRGDAAAIAKQRESFPDWDRYLENIVHFTRLPDLGTLTRRVRPAFVRRFLDAPFDLRPHLAESMIPLRLSAAEKDAVVAYLAELNGASSAPEAPSPPPSAAQVAQGRERFVALGCPTCHLFGNERFNPAFDRRFYTAMKHAAQLAPNLRFARERMPRVALVAYLQNPRAVDPKSTMPPLPIAAEDAERLADFLLHAPVSFEGAEPPPGAPDAPILARKVTYDEVHDRVLGRICVHCHMNPESNGGDGGAGNTGGLGFGGLKLDLESYAGVRAGLLRPGAQARVSVLVPEKPGEPPLLYAALLRRYREVADRRSPYADAPEPGPGADPHRPGMPLGLPPLDREQLSLVRTWLEQGAPGPHTP